MQYNNVIEVWFNYHTHPEHGANWEFYRVGEDCARFRGGFARCEDIVIDFDEGMHAIIYFSDGTAEHQWNLNKIIEAEKDVYDKAKEHQGAETNTQLPQPNINQAKV